ncbi:ABC transporter ATP-binding protein [Pseudonocardia sp. GCM10023141]
MNLRVLWSFVRPHRWVLALGIVLGLATTGATLATPMVTRSLLDGLASTNSSGTPIGQWVWLLVALLLAGAGFGLAQWMLLGRLAETIVLDARSAMVRRLFRVRLGELARRPGGELVTRVTSDTVLLREAAGSVVELVNGVVGIGGALVLMALLDGVLLATTLAAMIVVMIVFALLMPGISRAQKSAQAAVGRMGGSLEGALRAIRTVKASRAEERESARIIAEAEASRNQSVRAVRIEAVAWTVAGSGLQLAILLILAIGAARVGTGALAVSGLVAFLLYAFGLMDPVSQLSQSITHLQAGIAAAARIREIDGLEVERTGGVVVPRRETPAALSFRNVTARHAPAAPPAVAGVDLDIAARGHTAIVGPSGAGKTTLFSLMLGFVTPTGGELVLGGTPLASLPLAEVRRRIVYVEQDTPLVSGTLRENVLYTDPDAGEAAVWAALAAVRLDERARSLELGLDTPMANAVVSGGERQRIALARALVSDPEILLLDEATAQLDGLTEAAVQEAVRRVARTGAVVTIAHRLSTVVDADRIVVMEAGAVRAAGTHAELLASDALYRDLVRALKIDTGPAPDLIAS